MPAVATLADAGLYLVAALRDGSVAVDVARGGDRRGDGRATERLPVLRGSHVAGPQQHKPECGRARQHADRAGEHATPRRVQQRPAHVLALGAPARVTLGPRASRWGVLPLDAYSVDATADRARVHRLPGSPPPDSLLPPGPRIMNVRWGGPRASARRPIAPRQ
jgi:hypothetical protein